MLCQSLTFGFVLKINTEGTLVMYNQSHNLSGVLGEVRCWSQVNIGSRAVYVRIDDPTCTYPTYVAC